ncbi:hypothetical protein L3081_15305 [Colwellia sp. MSW7]|uniref:Uncharacterized protein n=1 Tax=Colwellia maritima TaxID=2912588 RepID=A0ABS9X2T3_9GAMM|nr:hypothetical protein [Colwellia maritima]MCI2284506.1 hypothetical protein [Colwellia maritima]
MKALTAPTNLNQTVINTVSKKILLVTVFTSVMASTSVFASENIFADKQTAIERHQEKINNENMGFGTGAIIGGVIALAH